MDKKLNCYTYIFTLGILTLEIASPVIAQTSQEKPNILWICTDQQRWNTIGALNNDYVHTPNLDRLVRDGVAFTHAFVQSPTCTPSQGEVEHPVVSLLDLYPTFNELAGLPDNPNEDTNQVPLDGYSLMPFLRNPTTEAWERPNFVTSVVQGTEITDMNDPESAYKQHYIATTEQYSYVLCNNGEEELYDIVADPYEWNNLAGHPQYQSVKDELKTKLQQRLARFQTK